MSVRASLQFSSLLELLQQRGPLTVILAGLVLWLVFRSVSFSNLKGKLPYPPGPRGIPLLGNALQFDVLNAWVPFTEWGKTYGPLMYLNLCGQHMIVINDMKTAYDLLDARSVNYSDRPRLIVASEIMTGGFLLIFTKYGDIFRRMRRAAHEALSKAVAQDYQPLQAKEAITLALGILQEPHLFDDHTRRVSASTTISMIYGTESIKSVSDPEVVSINNSTESIIRAALPGAHLVELFPWMLQIPRWFPGAGWKRRAEDFYKKDNIVYEDKFKDVERRKANGDDTPSFCASLIDQRDRNGLSLRQNSYLAATLYGAGAETSSSTLAWFIQAMILYPAVQAQAHQELDEIVGRSRAPTFDDYDSLVYIRAIVKEALRWRASLPLGTPHATREDDIYEGYFIPKNSIVIPNVWAMHKDQSIYGPDVDDFNPSRFIDAHGKMKSAPAYTKDEGHVGYGFGRRICVGRFVANNSLFINIASILWAAKIEPFQDDSGETIMPDVKGQVSDGLVVRPLPFKCTITPRLPKAKAILTQMQDLYNDPSWAPTMS